MLYHRDVDNNADEQAQPPVWPNAPEQAQPSVWPNTPAQESGPEEIPYQPVAQPYRPVPPQTTYHSASEQVSYPPTPEAYESGTRSTPVQTATSPAQNPPTWHTAGQTVPTPPVKPARSGLRTGAILLLALVLALVFGTGLFAGWEFGHNNATSTTPTLQGLQQNPNTHATIPALTGNNLDTVREAVVARVKPAVVQITVTTPQGSGLGSGVIIDRRGYIITNNHVVAGARTIDVQLADGTKQSNVQLVGTDAPDDLAVIKINPPANIVTASLGDSANLQVGQSVLAIGNPLGITQTVTSGIISALNRSVVEPTGAAIQNAIQTDAPINPGNSGGALVDLQGNLIGIPTLTAIDPEFNAPASGVGFAIPSNRVNFIAQQIIQDGHVTHTGRAALGIRPQDVSPDVAAMDNLAVDHGVLIVQTSNGGPAAQAGLTAGDVIVQIDNTPIDNISTMVDTLMTKMPGQKVSVKVYRGDQQLTVSVTLNELPANS